MTSKDRKLLFQRQAHAFGHLVEQAPPAPIALCPICLDPIVWANLDAGHVTIEDAPPRQHTRFGARRKVCLTCLRCNGRNAYEARAGRDAVQVRALRDGLPARLRGLVDGAERYIEVQRHEHGLHMPGLPPATQSVALRVDHAPDTQLTELRAAYLIAFSVLGYRWATSPGLDRVRLAIRDGDESVLDRPRGWIARDAPAAIANSVLIAESDGLVLVIGDKPRWGLALPLTDESHTPTGSFTVDGYQIPWLAHRWWREPVSTEPFIWDCQPPVNLNRPSWMVTVGPTAAPAPAASP